MKYSWWTFPRYRYVRQPKFPGRHCAIEQCRHPQIYNNASPSPINHNLIDILTATTFHEHAMCNVSLNNSAYARECFEHFTCGTGIIKGHVSRCHHDKRINRFQICIVVDWKQGRIIRVNFSFFSLVWSGFPRILELNEANKWRRNWNRILDCSLSKFWERKSNFISIQSACFIYRKISLNEIYYAALILFYKLIYIYKGRIKVRFNFSLINTARYFL